MTIWLKNILEKNRWIVLKSGYLSPSFIWIYLSTRERIAHKIMAINAAIPNLSIHWMNSILWYFLFTVCFATEDRFLKTFAWPSKSVAFDAVMRAPSESKPFVASRRDTANPFPLPAEANSFTSRSLSLLLASTSMSAWSSLPLVTSARADVAHPPKLRLALPQMDLGREAMSEVARAARSTPHSTLRSLWVDEPIVQTAEKRSRW